ncbi:acyl carrier protein [Corynebacterium aquatimens]|uniref:Acyl carrier protein n=1 Tax=Corynebacterium aquatimens TaxID=1190508 RepID=A0A931E1A8_9CORY|nr:acyl carrier protein [Corynebacterium aquatimens]MBG6122047.1 acyl carrier protein [Corynebacterium aquatimens]WJY65412.1 Meromycolate extension acyl carrier protein [Corynebacterium aquatimens]
MNPPNGLNQGLDLSGLNLDFGSDASGSEASTGVASASDSPVAAPEGDAVARIAGLLLTLGAVDDAEKVTSASTLDSLGVDSLTRIELAVRAEELFGFRVDEELFRSWTTIGDMAAYVDEHEAAAST